MSRRTGQSGHIEKSGKWWVVRWWMDVPGKEEREHKRGKICPVVGAGSLSESARKRRARKIIAESGADTEEHFNRVVKQASGVLFSNQAPHWLAAMRSRKRKPVAGSTLETWECCLHKWLNPALGDLPISEVNNSTVKRLVAAMSEGGLSAKSINNYVQVVKMIVASVVDGEGEEIYPRKWNHVFIDMPVVDKTKQNTPSFSTEIMTGLAAWKYPRERALFILGGAAGLRIGEALGLEIDKHVSPDFSTLCVVQKVRNCKVENWVKTASSTRMIDLHPTISALLKEFVGDRRDGFLFRTRNGKPLSASNILKRHLHPALKRLGYRNPFTGTYKAGNHAFRRYRNTFLRNEANCPAGLRKFWMGHAGDSMSDLYDKVKENLPLRKAWAEKCGFGFSLPGDVPNVPRIELKDEAVKVD
jgi:integrase